MIEEKDYKALESKIICAKCGNHFYLENEDGKLILRCMGSNECSETSCNTPVIMWSDLAAAVNSTSTIVDLHLDFLWEAIDHVRIDGYKTVMDILAEELDPKNTSFVLDTCWVAAGGGDVNAWIEKLAGRLDILHLKDITIIRDEHGLKPVMTEIGKGNLCWDSIISTAEKAGVKHYVVEQDAYFTESPLNSLKMSAEFLSKYRG